MLEERDDTRRNLDLIPDPFLLQQLISFNMEGNFDAVMGLIGCIIGLEEMHNLSRSETQRQQYSQLDTELMNTLVNNKRLFKK